MKFAIAASGVLRGMTVTTIQPIVAACHWFVGLRRLLLRWQEIRSIDVVLAGNPDQREQGIAPHIGQCRPIRRGVAVSATVQTGQSEAIHSADA